MNINYSPEFARRFKKLPKDLRVKALEKEKIFRSNPFDRSLKTHKLSGKLKRHLAFSVSHSCRIIFSMLDNKNVRFHSIGGHDIYDI